MSNSGRLVGIIIIVVGLLVLLGGSAVSVASALTAPDGGAGGAILGVVISVLVGAVPIAGGVFLLVRSRSEAAHQADAARQRKILDMVKTRGQVNLDDLVFDLEVGTEQIRADVYKLVGLGVFTGYVNWDKGELYSADASKLSGNTCPNCGGEQAFAGKGVIACQYCGAEIFL